MFNELLHQTYDLDQLRNHSDIHLLANVLCSLLANLPSTIFKEKEIADLIAYFDEAVRLSTGTKVNALDIFKSHSDDNADPDHDVASLSEEIINALKCKLEALYASNPEDRCRYGLMTLTFHLLKQVGSLSMTRSAELTDLLHVE